MGLIEQAAQRLEQLRRAGIEPGNPVPADPPVPAPAAPNDPGPGLQRADRPAPAQAPAQARRVTIDLARLAAAGVVTPGEPHSRIAHEMRVLKRPLLAAAFPEKGPAIARANLLIVTSSVPGEGKTFLSLNLAMSIAAEIDRKVLLVDADVARPTVPTLLGVFEERGLLDVIAGTMRPEEAILRTNVERLSYLPSGRPRPHAFEMLASESMAVLLEELASRYPDRMVVFDSPPLLSTTEARMLAARMGQVVFVVRAESTLQRDVKAALATIEECPIKLMVLNGARSHGLEGYGYGYGYGYGFDGSQAGPPKA